VDNCLDPPREARYPIQECWKWASARQ
jgi:hypothetical protein